jgi:hypothetical protein
MRDQELTRRRLLKRVLVTGAVLAGSQALPERWLRPVIDTAILPAHAQATVATTGILDLSLNSTTLTIGGPSVPYSILLGNATGGTLAVMVVQAYVEQGIASRAAGGFTVGNSTLCGTSVGDLDPGTCSQDFSVIASNSNAGSGTLVAGAATARFELRDDGVLIDQLIINVTLV